MTDRTTDIWEKLARCEKPVVLYGTGDGAEKILERLEARGIEAAGIFASDGFVRPGRTFRGLGVVSYAEAAERFGDMCVLVCFGSDRPEVIANIKRIAAEQELYMPDVPVCGGGTFDSAYYDAHRAELEQVRALLADEESRRCLDEVIEYKLSGEIEHLFACESGAEGLWQLLGPGPDEVYYDLGAYTGDTVNEFLRAAGGYRGICAFEPDARNFRKLRGSLAGLGRSVLLNAAAGAEEGEAEFVRNSGRGSARRSGKTVRVPVVTVHGVAGCGGGARACAGGSLQASAPWPPTIIKMDVEGAEADAISGAAITIARCRPKMMIAAYHRNEDLFAIPLQILSICPDYRLFLRHSPCLPAWELNYIFLPS